MVLNQVHNNLASATPIPHRRGMEMCGDDIGSHIWEGGYWQLAVESRGAVNILQCTDNPLPTRENDPELQQGRG